MGRQDVIAGRGAVELYLKDSLLIRGLQNAEKRFEKFGNKVRAFGSRLIKIGAGVTAVGGTIVAALARPTLAAAEMQEVMSKFSVVFGENADAVKKWGDDYAAEVGRSEKQLANFLSSNQDLLVPIGIDPRAATDMSKTLSKLSIDLASFNSGEGITDEQAHGDLQAALTGSGEVMKKYGVILNEAAVKQELLNQGIKSKNATEQEKVLARLAIIQRGTTAAQGDAIRTADSFTNQMKALNAEVSNASVAIGDALLPILTPLVKQAVEIVKKITEWAKQNQEMVRWVLKAAAVIIGLGAAITVAGGAFVAAGAIISGIGAVLGAAAGIVTFLVSAVSALFTPMGLLAAAVVAGIVAWARYTESGKATIKFITQVFGKLFAVGKQTIGGIVSALLNGDLEKATKIGFTGMRLAALTILNEISTAIGGVWGDTIAGIGSAILNGDFMKAWDLALGSMWLGWQQFTSNIVSFFAEAAKAIVGAFGELHNALAKLSLRAVQGTFNPIRIATKALTGFDLDKLTNDHIRQGIDNIYGPAIEGLNEWQRSFEKSSEQAADVLKKNLGGSMQDVQSEIAATQDKLDKLTAKPIVIQLNEEFEGTDGSGGDGPDRKFGKPKAAGTSVTFSASALVALGAGGGQWRPAEKAIANAVEKQARVQERQGGRLIELSRQANRTLEKVNDNLTVGSK